MGNPACDIVIVGGGSAGALLAAALSADAARRVILVERGEDFPAPDAMPNTLRFAHAASRDDNPECRVAERGDNLTELVREPHVRMYNGTRRNSFTTIPRGELIGGSSSINAAIYLWGLPEDYDHWAALGNEGWSYAEVRGTFAELETDLDFPAAPHGTRGPIAVRRTPREQWHAISHQFVAACVHLGAPEVADMNEPTSCPGGVGALPLNVERGIRYSSAIAYLTPEVRRRPNLTILDRTLVSRIVLDGSRAIAIAGQRLGAPVTIHASEIVLAAGAICTPQLMLLSGIGPADHLRELGIPVRHAAAVGACLADHPCIEMRWRTRAPFGFPRASTSEVSWRYTSPGSPFRDDMLFSMKYSSLEEHDGKPVLDRTAINFVVELFRTVGSGKLRLRSLDPTEQPLLDYQYLEHPEDRARMREGVRRAFATMACPELANLVVSPGELVPSFGGLTDRDAASDERLDAWLFDMVGTGQHTSSTCRMGPASDPLAVVDAHGRVHGLRGLRVVDASILPTCPRGNTNAPTMMVAAHIAKHMLAS